MLSYILAGLPLILMVVGLILTFKAAVVVPQRSLFVVERLGRFHDVLHAGFHPLLPFMDVVRYRHTSAEQAFEVPALAAITKDNIQVEVDGVIYLRIMDAAKASYGVADYRFAITQLAQAAVRSEFGKLTLERLFEERANINAHVVGEIDKASGPWGVKVLRYEIMKIVPPADIIAAMEKQMRAEREKRALILASEGQREAVVNRAEGEKRQVIMASEALRQQRLNVAEAEAKAIALVAQATADGIRKVAEATESPGGTSAAQYRLSEQYIKQFGRLARQSTTLVLPASVADVGSMVKMASRLWRDGVTTGLERPEKATGTVPARAAGAAAKTV